MFQKWWRTFYVVADLGNELSAARVAVNPALHDQVWGVAVGETKEGQEAEGRGNDYYRLRHGVFLWYYYFFFFLLNCFSLLIQVVNVIDSTRIVKKGDPFYKGKLWVYICGIFSVV